MTKNGGIWRDIGNGGEPRNRHGRYLRTLGLGHQNLKEKIMLADFIILKIEVEQSKQGIVISQRK